MKIAVIGSGISGLSSAYFLSKKHKVDLFEKEDHFGGHAHTIDINYDNRNKKKNIDRYWFYCLQQQNIPKSNKFF